MQRIIAPVLIGFTLSSAVVAAPQDYRFDMGHSRIFFDIDHRGYSTMLGRFADFGGHFTEPQAQGLFAFVHDVERIQADEDEDCEQPENDIGPTHQFEPPDVVVLLVVD